MDIREALKLERFDSDSERAYKILDACFVSLERLAGKMYYVNASKTKQDSIEELSTLSNPLVRCMQKTTYYVSPADDSVTLIEGHKTGTSKAADKGHELYSNPEKREQLAMQLWNNAFPTEQALMSAVAAHDIEIDYIAAFGETLGPAIEEIMHGLYVVAVDMFDVDEQELPTAHKKSETQKASKKSVKEMEQNMAAAAALQRQRKKGSDSDSETPAVSKAEIEELSQLKYIGTATAKAILETGWNWNRLRKVSQLHGKQTATADIEEILNSRQLESVLAALPAEV